MLLLAHPTGNTFFRAAARAFHHSDLLSELDCSICWNPDSFLSNFIPHSISSQLARRSFPEIPLSLQHSHSFREYLRLFSSILPFPFLRSHEHGFLSVDQLYQSFDRYVSKRLITNNSLKAVYAYEDAALEIFKIASSLSIHCIYDLPIGYWQAAQKIFAEERDLKPDWACTLSGLSDSPEKLKRKDEELSLASHVIVPSQFVRTTLHEFNKTSKPISVVPFGSPQAIHNFKPSKIHKQLRVLYVGSLGQRKGLSYLLDAIDTLGSSVSLTIIGKRQTLDCKPLNSALQRHQWIESLPHNGILNQMRVHDVLVLPSLFEGYALVLSEALSQGLPVIATYNSGATESVRNNIEGYIVPIRNSIAIAEKLDLLNSNHDLLIAMKYACIERATELNWLKYESRLQDIARSLIFDKTLAP